MNVAGEILQHNNKKAPFIALFLVSYCNFVFNLRQRSSNGHAGID
jgi:hypothetical protein